MKQNKYNAYFVIFIKQAKFLRPMYLEELVS